jgi:hypothetical protein
MSDFKFEKSKQANIIKSIRFPEDLNDRINEVVTKANKGKKTKEYSFNGFVVSACEYALKELNK